MGLNICVSLQLDLFNAQKAYNGLTPWYKKIGHKQKSKWRENVGGEFQHCAVAQWYWRHTLIRGGTVEVTRRIWEAMGPARNQRQKKKVKYNNLIYYFVHFTTEFDLFGEEPTTK